ncbi:hypothetical protein, partial [Paracoccus marinus]|uniref:hypothetical protein n=1 Tax=Paracoccus marinus TaxID=288426 RepID=UPI001C8F3780
MTIASGCEYRLRVQSGLTEHLVERLHRGDQSLLDLQQDSITLGFSQPQIVDLPGFCGERLAHFAGLSLEGDGALE